MNEKPLGCVLAGGRSSRMGRDKALIEFEGRPLIEHAVAALRQAGCEASIAASRSDLSAWAPTVADLHPGCGPLAGIEAMLHRSAGATLDRPVLFLSVDLPLMPPWFLIQLLARAQSSGAAVTLPRHAGRAQPLCAVYRTSLLPAISAALDRGQYKVMPVLELATSGRERDVFDVESFHAAQSAPYIAHPLHRWFANINTAADLKQLQQFAASLNVNQRIHYSGAR